MQPVHCSAAARVAKLPVAGSSILLGQAALCVRGRRPAREPSAPQGLPELARPLWVPVGGGPPARSPHASLRLGVVDLEARPGPAATHRHRSQALHALHTYGAGSLFGSSTRRLEARPGPSAAHGHRSQAPTGTPPLAYQALAPGPHAPIPEPTRNFACNSPDTISNIEFRSLELQRFRTMLKLLPIELHATFLERRH